MQYYSATERNAHWEFPGGPVVRTPILLPGSWAQSLIRELRSCKLCGKAKKKKKEKKEWSIYTCYNMGKAQKHGSVSEHDLKEFRYKRPHIVWFHLYEKPRIGKPFETDSPIAQSVENLPTKQERVSAKSPQSYLTLCNPWNCSPSASSVQGILQSRTLEWVAISSSRGSSWLRDGTCVSCVFCIGSGFFTFSAPWWWMLSDENLYVVQCRGRRFKSWVRKSPWRRKWQPTPVFLPGKYHGQRSMAGYSPQGRKSRTRLSNLNHHHHIETESSLLVYRNGRRVRKWPFDMYRAFLEASENISELNRRTSLVVRWIRICLPMQGTWVWSN